VAATPARGGRAAPTDAPSAAASRIEARDAAGVLAHVSEQYRSGGLIKADLRQQVLTMFQLYDAMRTKVTIDQVQLVNGGMWIYTTGEISGRLPFLGWVGLAALRISELTRRASQCRLAARARAAILSAKFTWLSSSGA
jgi:hypothetical protein